MANLPEVSIFETGIYQLERTDPIDAGVNGDGVSNLQSKQLANRTKYLKDSVDAITTELINARDGEASLSAKIGSMESLIQAIGASSSALNLENIAKLEREKHPSGFNYDVQKESLELYDFSAVSTTGDGNAARTTVIPGFYFAKTTGIVAGDSLKAYYFGNPKPLFVNGFPIKLERNTAKTASMVVNFPASPLTGVRQEMVFVEVWKEEVKVGVADSVFFPFGNVMFEGTGTFNSCTLLNTNQTGGNWPAYLAASGNHGYYVKSDDANIVQFINNPDNNVIVENDKLYQMRFRIRVSTSSASARMPHDDTTNIKAQGMLATPSAVSFASTNDDVGMSVADNASLAADSKVYAVPLALVHRRNSTAWSYTNPNGAGSIASGVSGRPDGKFHDQISIDDVLDLRCHISLNNQFDVQEIFNRTLNKVLSCNLKTSWEGLNSDSDGNETYKALDIYGTKLLRAEGTCGTNTFDASDEVIWCKKTSNGISSEFDGLRSYYSDIGGDQTVVGIIPNVGADGVNPTKCFTYVSSSKTLTIDATDFKSNDDLGQSARTKVSVRRPHLVWGIYPLCPAFAFSTNMTAGQWTGLGGDSASFVIDNKTSFILPYVSTAFPTLEIGDTYSSPNGVTCTVTGWTSGKDIGDYISMSFTGTTLPSFGTFTKVTGNGPASIIPRTASTTDLAGLVVSVSNIQTMKVGDVYNSPSSTSYTVSRVSIAQQMALLRNTSGTTVVPSTGTWTKISGSGPDTFVVSKYDFPNYGFDYDYGRAKYIGFGSNVMPSNAPIHINAYFTFQPGSGFINRIPYKDNFSFVATDYRINVGGVPTSILPNNGRDFIPVGTSVDPVNDGNVGVDSHTKTTHMMAFLRKGTVMDIGTAPGWYNALGSYAPCVIKDGSTYKMWFTGSAGSILRILYSTSSDGISWSTPQLAMDVGTEPNGYNSVYSIYPSVIKDGFTYKMWFTCSDNYTYRILYSTSTDGISWSTPQLAMSIGTEPNGYNSVHSFSQSVIKDGSTYKMWFAGYKSDNHRILYSTSSDGISWSTPQLVMSIGTEPNGYNSAYSYTPCVIKDGSVYKMWSVGRNGTTDRILYSTSFDGITWSAPQLFMDIGTDPNGYNSSHSFSPYVIKDGSTYKMWFTGSNGTNYRILYAVLAMTDPANTGSSTTGVYSTTGPLNCCPAADSQVVLFYEAAAEQYPATEVNGTFTGVTIHDTPDNFISCYGTGIARKSSSVVQDVWHWLAKKALPYTYLCIDSVNVGNYVCGDIEGSYDNARADINNIFIKIDNGAVKNDLSGFVTNSYTLNFGPEPTSYLQNVPTLTVHTGSLSNFQYWNMAGETSNASSYIQIKPVLIALSNKKIYMNFKFGSAISYATGYSKVVNPIGRPIFK